MELLNQFQGFIGSIGFGFFFYMFFHFNFRIYQKTSKFIKIPVFLIIFLGWTVLYFLFLIKYTYGIMNIFYPLSIFIGISFYHVFYFIKFDELYIKLSYKIDKLIKLKIAKVFDIINSKKKEKETNVKITKSKK